jgi:hypothetical protein
VSVSYRMSGLLVESDVALPAALAGDGDDYPKVTIARAEVPLNLTTATFQGVNWTANDAELLLRVPGVGRFLIREGREILYHLDFGVKAREAVIFLVGSAFGIALHQRRQFVLHASAVEVNGKAALFCGPSGAGKSTIAAALVKEGCSFVTDDICLMAFDSSQRPYVLPDGRMLKLWEDALNALAMGECKGEAVRQGIRKFYVAAETDAVPVPAAVIYILRELRAPLTAGIERLGTADAVAQLNSLAYRPALAREMGLQQPYFYAAAKLLRRCWAFRLTRPLDFGVMPEVIGWLADHWRELGLCL